MSQYHYILTLALTALNTFPLQYRNVSAMPSLGLDAIVSIR